MAPIEEVTPAEGQNFIKEVDNTKKELAQEERVQEQDKEAQATGGNEDEAQNQINTTA